MPPHVLRRFLLPTLALSLAIFLHALSARLGVEHPYHLPIFDHLFALQDSWTAMLWLAIVAGVVVGYRWWPHHGVLRLVGWLESRPWPVAIAAAGLLALGAVTVYEAHPLSMDEYSAVFQARLFSAGQIWAEFHPSWLDWLIPRPFQSYFFTTSHEVGWAVSSYWPGFALLLAPFSWLGAPWLLNPLLAAGSLVLLHRMADELYPDTQVGGWAVLFALASPQFTITALSFYSMTAHLFTNLAFALLLLRPTGRRAFAAGVVGSVSLVLHQPMAHTFFALPWLVWLASSRERRGGLWALFAGYLPLSLALGVGWAWLRTSIHAPAASAADPAAAGGGGLNVLGLFLGNLGVFALPDMSNLYDRLVGLEKLFLWTVPGLLVLAFWGWWAGREKTGIRLVAASAVTSFVGFLFIPLDQGHGWGFRYFHQAWAVLPLLAAGAMVSVGREWRGAAGALALGGLLLGTPLAAHQVHGFIERHLAQLPPIEEGAPQVVFLQVRHTPYYRVDLVQNDPLLRDPVLILVSHGPSVDERFVRHHFPNARLAWENGRDSVWRLDDDVGRPD